MFAQTLPIYYWKPLWPKYRYRSNFGDTLVSLVVERLVGQKIRRVGRLYPFPKLLPGGSVLAHAHSCDTAWSIGSRQQQPIQTRPDICAVRGPMTREVLQRSNVPCPEIYGDFALLLPMLCPELKHRPVKGRIGFMPHLRHCENVPEDGRYSMMPNWPVEKILHEILSCEQVVSASLHGLIVAEAFGIPAVWLPETSEPEFKYLDYYASTDRPARRARNFAQALELMEAPPAPLVNVEALRASFPYDVMLRKAAKKGRME